MRNDSRIYPSSLFFRLLLALGLFSAAVATSDAQQPNVVHGQLSTDANVHDPATQVAAQRGEHIVWLAWPFETLRPGSMNYVENRTVYLEGNPSPGTKDDVTIAGTTRSIVLIRITDGIVTKLRLESPERILDAGEQKILWLPSVDGDASVRFLASFVRPDQPRDLRSAAVFAVATHKADAALPLLIGFTGTQHDPVIRENAAFWLASQRDHEGFLVLQKLARSDADDRFREKLVFDFTVSKDSEAIKEVIRMSHEDASPAVRKQAQFWIATKAGRIVAPDLASSAENDPASEVRKAAVFALSRLPEQDATIQLIHVADTSKDPAVRKQAVFWLGQSKDPQALDYLAKLVIR